MKKTKTTRIEKKYKDKKTGEYKTLTIDYAKVADRLNEFRSDNPRGSIETKPEVVGDRIFFKATILKDKADQSSADATGHAVAKDDGSEKIFEKLETLAVGRALAMLGYSAGGEIASAEEMEEFESYKKNKIIQEKILATEKLEACKTVDELKKVFTSLGSIMAEPDIIKLKDELKLKLQ
jgi:hypothetical protein